MTEIQIIMAIANRAHDLAQKHGDSYPLIQAAMDIECVHQDQPLKLNELLGADDYNFAHDVLGIRANLNRKKRRLENCFVPRFSR